jgi:hypothetical protein
LSIGRVPGKGVQLRVAAAGTDPKQGAEAASIVEICAPAVIGRPIEIAVAALHQAGLWIGPIVGEAAKGVKIRFRLCSGIQHSTRQNQQDTDEWNAKYLHGFLSSVLAPRSRELVIHSRKSLMPQSNLTETVSLTDTTGATDNLRGWDCSQTTPPTRFARIKPLPALRPEVNVFKDKKGEVGVLALFIDR